MAAFDQQAISTFLRRCYFAADGLWFMAVEGECSYEEALRLDERIWEIMPKIQVRSARELLGLDGSSLGELRQGLELKFASEGYDYIVRELSPDVLRIIVQECPWLTALRKAGRMHIAAEICDRICQKDLSGWAAQFSGEIGFSLKSCMGANEDNCELCFASTKSSGDEK
jgi:hypothetical protein